MIFPSFLSPTQGVSRSIRAALSVVLAAGVLGVIGGCDAVTVQSDTPTDSESFDKADLQYEPVSLASGELFSIELTDDQFEQAAARIVHEGTADGGQRLRARFTSLNPSSVTVTCRDERRGTKQKMATLTGDQLTAKGSTGTTATTSDIPDSFHYIDNGDNVIVEVDYETDEAEVKQSAEGGFNFQSASQTVRCTHVSFSLEGVTADVTADDVQFGGDVTAPSIQKQSYR